MSDYTATQSSFSSEGNLFSRFLSHVWNSLVILGTTNQRLRQVEALQRLTDEELAERGIKRSEIARHVFLDLYWA